MGTTSRLCLLGNYHNSDTLELGRKFGGQLMGKQRYILHKVNYTDGPQDIFAQNFIKMPVIDIPCSISISDYQLILIGRSYFKQINFIIRGNNKGSCNFINLS